MKKNISIDWHTANYEEWVSDYPYVIESEVEALRQMIPEDKNMSGIEVGLGTGKYAEVLGIKKGIETSPDMRSLAISRGIEVADGIADHLPYEDFSFEFVLMAFCIRYFNDLHVPFQEAYRVLKSEGVLVIGFIDRNSIIGQYYEQYKPESTFYKQANVYSVDKVVFELNRAGFRYINFCQTLFKPLDEINTFEPAKPGYGEGSFVVIQAMKKMVINII